MSSPTIVCQRPSDVIGGGGGGGGGAKATGWKRYQPWFPCPVKSFIFPRVNNCTKMINTEKEDLYDSTMDVDLEFSRESRNVEELVGGHLAVKPFLSNNGKTTSLIRSNGDVVEYVDIDVVKGKYLVIGCFSVPMFSRSLEGDYCRAMINAYSELNNLSDDFEMVVVVKMKKGFENDESTFLKFFSAFNCLAIPFSDVETRHSICSYIGFNLSLLSRDVSAIVVDPFGTILQYLDTPELFLNYGSEWFPFHDTNVKAIDTQDSVIRIRLDPLFEEGYEAFPKAVMSDPLIRDPLSLHNDILLCDPSLKLWRVGPAGGSLAVSELANKYVGLYLCINGYLMDKINEVHKQCLKNNQELEIVLVCLPLSEETKTYQHDLIRALELYNITSWLLFPFISKVCRRMWRIFGQASIDDKLIILPPNCKSGELEGIAVITLLGMNEYPFTRSSVRERRFATLRSLTPASWFKGTRKGRTCLCLHGKTSNIRESELQGKKLLLFLDWLQFSDDGGKLCRLLMKHYSEIQLTGWEVVFVPLDQNVDATAHCVKSSKMPWPIMPVHAAVGASVANQLIFKDENYCNHIMAIGKDGRILSRQVEERLMKYGVSETLFDDKLFEEITTHLALLEDP